MADQQYEVGLRVSTKSDDSGIAQSERAMQRLGAETERTVGILGNLKETAKGVGEALLAAFGSYKLIQWLIDGAKAAMEKARALSQLSNMAKQFGQDGSAAAKAAEALGKALQAKGFQGDEVIKAVRTLIPLTRDYGEAISAVTMAANLSAKTGVEFGTALVTVRSLVEGSERAVRQANLLWRTDAKTTQGVLDEWRKSLAGSAAALDDAEQKVDSFRAAFQNLWQDIGGPVAKALVFLIESLKDIGRFFAAVGLRAVDMWDRVKLAFTGMKILIDNFDIKHPVESMKRAMAEFEAEEKKYQEASRARWQQWAADILKARAGGEGPAPGGKVTAHPPGAGIPSVPGGELDAAKIFNDQLFAQIAALQKYYGKVRDLRAKHDREEKDAIAANFRAIKDYYFKLEDVKQAEIELERRVQVAKIAAQQQAIEGAIGMLMAAFPQSREIAAAQALINTYQAATKALAEGGPYLGPILAAIITIAGMAQVANIYATEPGSAPGGVGGAPGSPFGPPIAVTGADATPPPMGAGAVSTTSVTTNAPSTTVINIDALDTTDALRRAQRALRPAERSYNRTIVSRGGLVVGSKRNR